MTFGTDKQTLSDLNIFPQFKRDVSIFDFYNRTVTVGGSEELYRIMNNPLNGKPEIDERLNTFKYLIKNNIVVPLDKDYLDFVEFYLNQNTKPLYDHFIDAYVNRLSYAMKPNNDYYVILRGVEYVKNHLISLDDLLQELPPENMPALFTDLKQTLRLLKENEQTQSLFSKKEKLSYREINRFDNLIRGRFKHFMEIVLRSTYRIDAFQSALKTAKLHNLCFPEVEVSEQPRVEIEQLFHPLLKNPVKNDIAINHNNNFLFLTGSNMSGKSTFLKATGMCIYLAHIGFPVPATSMRTSLFNGIYTTINLPDDIFKGYSHYYSEVRRLKEIALRIKERKNVLVIFDELFRGTNVKDAYDATLLVTSEFPKITRSLFLISSHILEVGEALKTNAGVAFKCFESYLENGNPVYTYKLKDGISTERLGLTILQNEGVLSVIKEITFGTE